ncbi:MAG TPA: hypothetical protein VK699_21350 [Terriglobales bacterium]|jgi:hypothetical protein|nr:hypothetical protein [Terriglobales bacterium]
MTEWFAFLTVTVPAVGRADKLLKNEQNSTAEGNAAQQSGACISKVYPRAGHKMRRLCRRYSVPAGHVALSHLPVTMPFTLMVAPLPTEVVMQRGLNVFLIGDVQLDPSAPPQSARLRSG